MPIAVGMPVSIPLGTGVAVFLDRRTPSGGSGSGTIGVTIGTGAPIFLHGHAPDCIVIVPCHFICSRSPGGRQQRQRLPGGQGLLNSTPHFSGTKGFCQPTYSSLLKEGHRLTRDGIPCKENKPLLQLRILLQRLVEA